jgi:Cu-Zn family superoxide dismutase
MTNPLHSAALLVLVAAAAPLAALQAGPTARAEIKGDGITGTATFREVPARRSGADDPRFPASAKLVEVTIDVSGLKPGAHGVHLHAVGRCEAPGFTSAGGHFDPGPASQTDPDTNHPFHMGDLPNLIADATGKASYTAVTSRVTISAGPLSVFDSDGTAIIIHVNPDQGTTGAAKSGVSGGPRAACGVLTK